MFYTSANTISNLHIQFGNFNKKNCWNFYSFCTIMLSIANMETFLKLWHQIRIKRVHVTLKKAREKSDVLTRCRLLRTYEIVNNSAFRMVNFTLHEVFSLESFRCQKSLTCSNFKLSPLLEQNKTSINWKMQFSSLSCASSVVWLKKFIIKHTSHQVFSSSQFWGGTRATSTRSGSKCNIEMVFSCQMRGKLLKSNPPQEKIERSSQLTTKGFQYSACLCFHLLAGRYGYIVSTLLWSFLFPFSLDTGRPENAKCFPCLSIISNPLLSQVRCVSHTPSLFHAICCINMTKCVKFTMRPHEILRIFQCLTMQPSKVTLLLAQHDCNLERSSSFENVQKILNVLLKIK